MSSPLRWRPLLVAPVILAFFFGARALPAKTPIDFSRQILPILSDACFRCHGPDAGTREAHLRLDQKDGLFRTKNDVTVVKPGRPEESELFLRIASHDEEEVMPPLKSARRLKPAEIALLKEWIVAGAEWGTHWAFAAPQSPPVPVVRDGALSRRVRNPIDAFVLARLEREKISPAPEAERHTLLRRVALDLTGVPPTPAEVAAFVADRRPDAYERVVDSLLSSPRYGERWAWEWLDLARYADTNGFQGDPERTMWPWRDWVVKALNANQPFNQFTIEQLAGDLLPGATPDQKLASGFHRNNMFNGEGGRIAEETRVENIFDRVETTATVWMGLTFTCTRCHDHKFDPLKQTDYFALYDIFNQMSETGGGGGRGQIPPVLDLSSEADLEAVKLARAHNDEVAKQIVAYELIKFPRAEGAPLSASPIALKLPGNLQATLVKAAPRSRGIDGLLEAIPYFRETEPDPEYVQLLEASLAALRKIEATTAAVTKVMIMDQLEKPRDTFVLSKGNYEAKTEVQVFGDVPALFRAAAMATPDRPEPKRLNRLDLARWLVSPENPLAARTAVNRAWQSLFGVGLVKTAEDFGVQGERPLHPELLDWLATEYVARGWDTKALHRLIVTSGTYRQSSRVTPAAYERDPENRLLARGSRHRLPSWMLRDQALAAAGLLVESTGGPAVKPYQPPGIWEEATFGKKNYVQDHGPALYRRSLYVYWRRIVGPTMLFDAGARQVCSVKATRTNTPLHALVTLNDPTYVEAARVMAQRVLASSSRDGARLEEAFKRVLGRPPATAEKKVFTERLKKLRARFRAEADAARDLSSAGEAPRPAGLAPAEHAAWTTICLVILNLDETLSKE